MSRDYGLSSAVVSLFILFISELSAQNVSRPVNILIINDLGNDVANKSVTNSLKTLRDKSGLLGNVLVAQVNSSLEKETLDAVCGVWKSALAGDENNLPDFVLDTTTYGEGAEVINRFTALLGIPTLTAQFGQEGDLYGWREITEEQKKYLVQVMNPADLIAEIVSQHCLEFNINNAVIIHDESFIMSHKRKSLIRKLPIRVVSSEPPGTKLQSQISKLRDLYIVNFFVLGRDETINAALEAANNLNFIGYKYGWFGVSLNENFSPKCQSCGNASIMIFKPGISKNQQELNELTSKGDLQKPRISSAFYYDLTRMGVLGMKAAIDEGEWKRPKYQSCDVFDRNASTPTRNVNLRQRLQQVTNKSDFKPKYSSFVWGKNGETRANFEVKASVIRIVESKPIENEAVETWQSGIDSKLKVLDTKKAANHTAMPYYRIVTVIKPPFVYYNNVTNTWYGFCIDMLNEIRKDVKFEYEIYEVPDREYGNMDDNGNWNGMVEELKEKRAEIALGALTVEAERKKILDYTVPYYDLVGISILRKKPTLTYLPWRFFTVLELDVWFCILGAYLFTSVLMWIFDRYSPYSYRNSKEKYKDDDEKREFHLKECLWFCLTSLTPQGGGEAPKNLSGRLVAATWWLFGFIIIASYTANLAAVLTVGRIETRIESLEDLSRQYKIQYAPIMNSSEYRFFFRMTHIEKIFYEKWKAMSLNDSLPDVERAKLAVWDYPVSDKYTKMFQTMKDGEGHFPKSMEHALAKVRNSTKGATEFALIGEANDIKYLIMTNCEFMRIGDEFSRKPYAIGIKKGLPLRDQFNKAILRMENKRYFERLKKNWWENNPENKHCTPMEDSNDGMSFWNIWGLFTVVVTGLVLSCSAIIFEYFYYNTKSQFNAKMETIDKKTKEAEFNKMKVIMSKMHPAPAQDLPTVYNPRSSF